MAITEITANIFHERLSAGESLNVLDVRTDIECRTEAIDYPFIHVPLHLLDSTKFVKDYGVSLNGKPLYILCRSGGRARKAAEGLFEAGLSDIIIVTGGLGACIACGTRVRKGATISLERQVRIAAGTLVLVGVLLGHFVSNDFYILSGLIGGGLIFAGITDWCGMAMLLARAPWNVDRTQQAIEESIQTYNKKGE